MMAARRSRKTAAARCIPQRGHFMSELVDTNRLTLVGALTVRNIEQIRTRLLQAMRRHRVVVVDCALATGVDLSFLQLVLAARKSAAAAGKTVALADRASGVLCDGLLEAGLLSPAGSPPAADQ